MLDGSGWSTPRSGRFNPGKDTILVAQEAGWPPRPLWPGEGNLVPSGVRNSNGVPVSNDLSGNTEKWFFYSSPGCLIYFNSSNIKTNRMFNEQIMLYRGFPIACKHFIPGSALLLVV